MSEASLTKLEVCEGAGLGLVGVMERVEELAVRPQLVELDGGPHGKRVLVVPGSGQAAFVQGLETGLPRRGVWVDSVGDFGAYVEAAAARTSTREGRVEVWVGTESVVGNLAAGTLVEDGVSLGLDYAPEFSALLSLGDVGRPVDQKTLWRRLMVDLRDEVSEVLVAQIASCSVAANSSSESRIELSGVTSSSGAAGVKVKLGVSEAQVQCDWTYKGRVYACLEQQFEVPLRLEVVASGGSLGFVLHVLRKDRVLEQARNAVAEVLLKVLPAGVPVYLGRQVK